MTNYTSYITFAHQLADVAGDAIRPYFGQHGAVETKGDHSPVTQADKAAETAIRAMIASAYPDHGIYGEEHGQTGLDKTYIWVIDPIDGTRAFIAGKKEWGTLIALCENGVPILGVLDQPITGERWVGVMGQPTLFYPSWREGEAHEAIQSLLPEQKDGLPRYARNDGIEIKTRPCPSLAEAVISCTYCAPPDDARFAALAAQCKETIDGGDCYAYGLLTRGERDIVCDTALKPYDILALVPIIEGAGGKITGWDNAPVTLSNYSQIIACGNAKLWQQIRTDSAWMS
jgi:inositol-phosphate phosphatase/L-galactose 1-phosphate phosphatase/histidinol-phosphatase